MEMFLLWWVIAGTATTLLYVIALPWVYAHEEHNFVQDALFCYAVPPLFFTAIILDIVDYMRKK